MHIILKIFYELFKFIWKQFKIGGILVIILLFEIIGLVSDVQEETSSNIYDGELAIESCEVTEVNDTCQLRVTIKNSGSYYETVPEIVFKFDDSSKWINANIYGTFSQDSSEDYQETVIPAGQQVSVIYEIPKYEQNRDAIRRATDTTIRLQNAGMGEETEYPIHFY